MSFVGPAGTSAKLQDVKDQGSGGFVFRVVRV